MLLTNSAPQSPIFKSSVSKNKKERLERLLSQPSTNNEGKSRLIFDHNRLNKQYSELERIRQEIRELDNKIARRVEPYFSLREWLISLSASKPI